MIQCNSLLSSVLNNPDHALDGIEGFSHLWILFHFHKNGSDFSKNKVNPPRKKDRGRVGVFATRSPHRPNAIGMSLAKLVEVGDNEIHVEGTDLVDGTPILDVKPYIPSYDAPKIFQGQGEQSRGDHVLVPEWINNAKDDLDVAFTPKAEVNLSRFAKDADEGFRLESFDTCEDLRLAACQILRADPRSRYRREKLDDRIYFFTVDTAHFSVWFDGDCAHVLKVRPNVMEKS